MRISDWSSDVCSSDLLIAGSAYGLTAATRVHSPLFYAHLTMTSGASAEIPTGFPDRALYVASGAVEVGGHRYCAGQMLVLGSGVSQVQAVERSTVMMRSEEHTSALQ